MKISAQTHNPGTGIFIRVRQRKIWHGQKRSRLYDQRGRVRSDETTTDAHRLWKMEKAKKEFLSRASRGSGARLTPWFQTSGLQKYYRMNVFYFNLAICDHLCGGCRRSGSGHLWEVQIVPNLGWFKLWFFNFMLQELCEFTRSSFKL